MQMLQKGTLFDWYHSPFCVSFAVTEFLGVAIVVARTRMYHCATSFWSLCFNGLGGWLPKFSEHGDFLSDGLAGGQIGGLASPNLRSLPCTVWQKWYLSVALIVF